MQYIALLRGINVGGKSQIAMTKLKKVFEELGFLNVFTYINSGNVIFESSEKSSEEITKILDKELSKVFNLELKNVVISLAELEEVLDKAPAEWKNNQDLRKYIAFTIQPVTPKDIYEAVNLKAGTDSIKLGTRVVYMSTKLSGLTQSGFTQLAGKKVYKFMTIRNLNTIQKLLEKL